MCIQYFVSFPYAPQKFMMKTAQGGGHRTLLYGHAILLRHSYSSMYLCCLSTSRSSTDKLAFDVGLQEDTTGGCLGLRRCCVQRERGQDWVGSSHEARGRYRR
nr:ryanodine receptor 2-like [Camelus dromedarius]